MVGLAVGWWIPSPGLAHGALHQQLIDVSVQLAEHPDDFELLIRRGELQRLHGSWAESRVDLEHARKLRPEDVEPIFRLGRLELEADNASTAVTWLQSALEKKPHHIEAALLLGRAWVKVGKPAKAIEPFNTAIHWSREPRPEWFLERSKALLATAPDSKEALQLAEASLDEGLELIGPVPTLQLAAVELDLRGGRVDVALKRIDSVRATSERKEAWWFRRGVILEGARRPVEARAAFESARTAWEKLPDRLQRTLAMVQLRKDIEQHLESTGSKASSNRSSSP